MENAVQPEWKVIDEIDWSSELSKSICGPLMPVALASAMAAVRVMGLMAIPCVVWLTATRDVRAAEEGKGRLRGRRRLSGRLRRNDRIVLRGGQRVGKTVAVQNALNCEHTIEISGVQRAWRNVLDQDRSGISGIKRERLTGRNVQRHGSQSGAYRHIGDRERRRRLRHVNTLNKTLAAGSNQRLMRVRDHGHLAEIVRCSE